MKEIVWGQVLSVDVDEIDDDHRKLVGLFNLLSHAISDGDPPEYVAAVLTELVNCTIWHFSHEERLMLKYDYQDREAHQAEHQALIESVKALQQKVLQAGNLFVDDDIEYLERWLTEHIFTDDMRLGNYLADVM